MKRIKNILSFLVIFFAMNMVVTHTTLLSIRLSMATAMAAEKSPEFIVSEELDYQMDDRDKKDNRSWLSRNKWWVTLGIVIVAAGATAIAASKSSNDDKPGGADAGEYDITW